MSPAGNVSELRNKVLFIRQRSELTQEQLGSLVGLTRQTIIAIEKGRFTPSVATALSLARALNTTVDELFWLEEPGDYIK
jgi:putative transcriptional regulator